MAVFRYNSTLWLSNQGEEEIHLTLPPSKSLLIRRIFIQTAQFIRDPSIPTDDFNTGDSWVRTGGDDIDSALSLASMIRNTSSDPQVWEAGEAGTVMRFGLALLVFAGKTGILQGRGRAHARPIGGLVEALRQLGARIEYLEKEGYPPLQLKASSMHGGLVTLPSGISSQFASAILLAGLCKDTTLELTWGPSLLRSRPYLDMTVALLQQVGCRIETGPFGVRMDTRWGMKVATPVEGDWSAAAFWILRQAALPLAPALNLSPLTEHSLQGDALLYRWLPWLEPAWNASFTTTKAGNKNTLRLPNCPSQADGHAEASPAQNAQELPPMMEWDIQGDRWTCRAGAVPDLVPALAVWAVLRGLKLEIQDIGHLVHKESNRLEAITHNLQSVGIECHILTKETHGDLADVEAGDTVLQILPTQPWVDHLQSSVPQRLLEFRSYQDHRIVMAMSMLALPGWDLTFDDAGVVAKSYPLFWEHWKILGYEWTS